MGQVVYCPAFPIEDEVDFPKDVNYHPKQNLEAWTKTFEKNILPQLNGKEKLCFIGHSLGNVFILHLVEKYNLHLDCAIFVSPFFELSENIKFPYDNVNRSFYKSDFDFEKLTKLIPISYVLYSDTDPYVEPYQAIHFAKMLNSSHIMVRKGGHMNAAVNLNEFPLVYDLCISRLDLNLYQKYAMQREVHDTVNFLTHSEKKCIVMSPEQLTDEGTFHFMELKKGGFATFMSNSKDWNPEDQYFVNGRKCALSGLDIARVFVICDKKDIKKEKLKKQIKLDIDSGIKVYVVNYEDFKTIGCEDDFGIWDNEYVCIQHRDSHGNITDGLIDARVKTLLTAQNWRDRILRMAKKISNLEMFD